MKQEADNNGDLATPAIPAMNNCRLQVHTQRLKRQRATLGQQLAHTRLKLAMARWEMARLKLAELERELKQQFRQDHLYRPALPTRKATHAAGE